MSEGGSKKVQLAELNKQLNAEIADWHKSGIDPSGWRMGPQEFTVRCEIIAMSQILKDKLGMSQDDLDIYLKTTVLEQMRLLRPVAEEQKANAIRDQITKNIKI